MLADLSKIEHKQYEFKIAWSWVFYIGHILCGAIFGIYYIIAGEVSRKTYIATLLLLTLGNIGITSGAHRLFCHKSYKVTHTMKIFMIICQQISGMKSIMTWSRIHRVHHKFYDTDKDPTNINRGLFFSFLGWMLLVPTPECKTEIKRIYMDDLLMDRELYFQYKFYPLLFIVITIGLPTLIPYYFWNESILVALGSNFLRIAINGIQQFIGNSLLHWNGRKPYDSSQTAIDNVFYNILTLGEGFHNFHHAFPFDYRSNELSELWHLTSISTIFIDFCALLGLVYDRKKASPKMIERRIARLGDGSHVLALKNVIGDANLWGFGDSEMDIVDIVELDNNKYTK